MLSFEDKPIALSLKDYIVRKLSVKMMMDEQVINKIISHQFNAANEATKNNYSIELSGFGKFLFNNKKAIKKIEELETLKKSYINILFNKELSERRKETLQSKLDSIELDINTLKKKTNEFQSNIGRVEKQVDSSKGPKGVYQEDSLTKN